MSTTEPTEYTVAYANDVTGNPLYEMRNRPPGNMPLRNAAQIDAQTRENAETNDR